nr:hypothetical protein [Acinetobacter pittii]
MTGTPPGPLWRSACGAISGGRQATQRLERTVGGQGQRTAHGKATAGTGADRSQVIRHGARAGRGQHAGAFQRYGAQS